MKNLLSLEKMSREEMQHILAASAVMKRLRGKHGSQPLAGQIWALLFTKSSTRTRVSFEVGIRELGGQAIFLSATQAQLGRGEPIKDTARVLARMIQGAVIRTYAQQDVEEFAQFSGLPTINALTDQEHPCQILADIFTFQEKRGPIEGKRVVFVGDGACNVPVSWMFAAGKLGFELRIAAPEKFQPSAELLRRAGGHIVCTEDVRAAAQGADLLYTDVLGLDGQGIRVRRPGAGIIRLPDQRRVGQAGPARRAGHALSAGLSRQGNRRGDLRGQRGNDLRAGRQPAALPESDS